MIPTNNSPLTAHILATSAINISHNDSHEIYCLYLIQEKNPPDNPIKARIRKDQNKISKSQRHIPHNNISIVDLINELLERKKTPKV